MNHNYLLKHWFVTLVLAPLLYCLYDLTYATGSDKVIGFIALYPIVIIFSFLFSLPTVLAYFLIFRMLTKQKRSPLFTKFILISVTVIGIAITLSLIGGYLSTTLGFAFSFTSIITGCLFKIQTG